jgi:hypothetical protein
LRLARRRRASSSSRLDPQSEQLTARAQERQADLARIPPRSLMLRDGAPGPHHQQHSGEGGILSGALLSDPLHLRLAERSRPAMGSRLDPQAEQLTARALRRLADTVRSPAHVFAAHLASSHDPRWFFSGEGGIRTRGTSHAKVCGMSRGETADLVNWPNRS